MITLEQSADGDQLLFRGKRVRRDRQGNHVAQFDRIKFADLSTLPAGTRLVLEYGEQHRTEEDLIMLTRIDIISSSKVRAFGDHFRCPGCWEHGLSWDTYMGIAEAILTSPEAESAGIHFEGLVADNNDHLHQVVSVELDNQSPISLVNAISGVVLPFLRPLTDLQERIDLEADRMLGN